MIKHQKPMIKDKPNIPLDRKEEFKKKYRKNMIDREVVKNGIR